MRFRGMVAGLAVVAALLASATSASAEALSFPTAKRLANRLALKYERDAHSRVVDWEIFSPERVNRGQVVFLFSAEHANGRICDAEIVVKVLHSRRGRAQARFRDAVCDGP
jgi:hypothetical protein